MDKYLYTRVMRWLRRWPEMGYIRGVTPILGYSEESARDFVDMCTNSTCQGFAGLMLNTRGRPSNHEEQIQRLLAIASPTPANIVKINDPVAMWGEDRVVEDRYGEVNAKYEMWVAYAQHRNQALGVALTIKTRESDRDIFLLARFMLEESEAKVLVHLINGSIPHLEVVNIYQYLYDEFRVFLRDTERACSYALKISLRKDRDGLFRPIIDDSTVWPHVIPLVAESVKLFLDYLPHPTDYERSCIEHAFISNRKPRDRVLCVFRNRHEREMIVVAEDTVRFVDSTRNKRDGYRMIMRVNM